MAIFIGFPLRVSLEPYLTCAVVSSHDAAAADLFSTPSPGLEFECPVAFRTLR